MTLVEDVGDTELVTREPAPQPGERVHYRTFVSEMGELMEQRFL